MITIHLSGLKVPPQFREVLLPAVPRMGDQVLVEQYITVQGLEQVAVVEGYVNGVRWVKTRSEPPSVILEIR